MVDALPILNVELDNVLQSTSGRVKLGDHREFLRRVDCIRASRTVEILVAQTIRVDITAIPVCRGNVSVTILCTTFRVTIADVLPLFCAWVGGESCGHGVSFPQIHLCATSTQRASATVVIGVAGVHLPILDIRLTLHELDVASALPIAVTSPVGCTSFVGTSRVSSAVHLHKVYC